MPIMHMPQFTLNQMVAAAVESRTSDFRAAPTDH